MQIILFEGFSKRENSTKLPDSAVQRTNVNGFLREPCSITNPVFKIERLAADASPHKFTYAVITKFARYYFVKDWVWMDGVWQCTMEEDVLASFRPEIATTSAYVERSTSQYDGSIQDTFYPTKATNNQVNVAVASHWLGVAPNAGCYVLGILCNTNRATSQLGGAVTYYVLTPEQMGDLMEYLLSDDFLDDNGYTNALTNPHQQILHDAAKALINPIQYIASCMWFPFPASDLGDGQNHRIVLGFFDLDQNYCIGQYLVAGMITQRATCAIPDHPQIARGEYLNNSPYTRLTLNLPPFGSIPLDASFRPDKPYMLGEAWIDPVTGKATLRISFHHNQDHSDITPIVRECTTMFGVPIQLAQMGPDYINLIGNALNVASSIASGMSGDIGAAAAISQTASGIGNGLNSLMPQVETQGISGSFAAYIMPAYLTAQFFIVTDENAAEFGKPLCQTLTIQTMTGFIKCKEADVNFSCLKDEKTKILQYMLSGFFWE